VNALGLIVLLPTGSPCLTTTESALIPAPWQGSIKSMDSLRNPTLSTVLNRNGIDGLNARFYRVQIVIPAHSSSLIWPVIG